MKYSEVRDLRVKPFKFPFSDSTLLGKKEKGGFNKSAGCRSAVKSGFVCLFGFDFFWLVGLFV